MTTLWNKFTAWLSGWPESTEAGRKMARDEELFLEEEVKHRPDKPLKLMNKRELEEYGRTIGIELDRRHTKARLIATIGEHSG
jgi:hypothetical protein